MTLHAAAHDLRPQGLPDRLLLALHASHAYPPTRRLACLSVWSGDARRGRRCAPPRSVSSPRVSSRATHGSEGETT